MTKRLRHDILFVRTKVAEKNCVSLPIYAESGETQKSGAVISAQNFDITNSGRVILPLINAGVAEWQTRWS